MTVHFATRRPASRRVAAMLAVAALATGGVLVAADQFTSPAAGTVSPARNDLEREAGTYLDERHAQTPEEVAELARVMGMTAEEAARVQNDCRLRYELRLPPCVSDGDPRY